MAENKNNISLDTKIEFTIKGFISTIVAILGIAWGFYGAVVNPRIEKAEQHHKEILEEVRNSINTSIEELKVSVDENNARLENSVKNALDISNANTRRFNDLNNLQNQSEGNTGGGTSN
jgi:hypothetical protein